MKHMLDELFNTQLLPKKLNNKLNLNEKDDLITWLTHINVKLNKSKNDIDKVAYNHSRDVIIGILGYMNQPDFKSEMKETAKESCEKFKEQLKVSANYNLNTSDKMNKQMALMLLKQLIVNTVECNIYSFVAKSL